MVISILFCATTLAAQVMQPIAAAPQLLVPAAGSIRGANGTFFRSDIALVNFASHDQTIKLQWLPQGGGTVISTTITIPAQQGIRSSDFVASVLGATGLGSIIISGVNADNTVDTSALLYASSRIWTVQPGSQGTTSQSFPVIPLSALSSSTPVASLFAMGGLDNPTGYRTNVGVVNADPTKTQTFDIAVPNSSSPSADHYTVSVLPMSMMQISVGTLLANAQIVIQNTTPAATQTSLWLAYGSTIDNITGDAWSQLAVAGQVQ